MLAIAVCDYHRRFTFVAILHAPQTHDSLAFEASDLGWLVAQGKLITLRLEPNVLETKGDVSYIDQVTQPNYCRQPLVDVLNTEG